MKNPWRSASTPITGKNGLGRSAGAQFSDLIDHEIAPGNTVDDGAALRVNILARVAAFLPPTSTVPTGTDSDATAVVDAWGQAWGVEGLRVVGCIDFA